uniref:ABC transporter substrate-binding protein n=1 Tax=Anaerolinea thermolimosa TaxID=229919 RepID=A0A7C4PTT2_9CHLR
MFSKVFKKGVWLVALLALGLSSLLSGCVSSKTIKIGFIAQMTGPDSYIGQAAKLALEDRIAEINEKGGIKGYKIELITYDSRSEVPDAVAAAKRLMDQDHVSAIIGPEWSGAAIPIASIADASKTPVIATTASNIKVTVDDNGNVHPFMFRVCFIDPYQGFAIADFAYKELGKRKAAFITDVSAAYSVGIQNYFEEHFTSLGGEVVAKEGYQANDQEFRAQISKVAESGADLLVVPTATYRDIALIAKQADALGLKIQYLGVDGWVADELLSMAGKELDGAYLSSGVTTESPEFKDYNAAFEKKHGMKATVYAYYALDALYAIEYAANSVLDQSPSADPGSEAFRLSLKSALETMKDVPAFTSKLTIEPDTHNPHNKPVVILQIKDGQWKIVKTYEP